MSRYQEIKIALCLRRWLSRCCRFEGILEQWFISSHSIEWLIVWLQVSVIFSRICIRASEVLRPPTSGCDMIALQHTKTINTQTYGEKSYSPTMLVYDWDSYLQQIGEKWIALTSIGGSKPVRCCSSPPVAWDYWLIIRGSIDEKR